HGSLYDARRLGRSGRRRSRCRVVIGAADREQNALEKGSHERDPGQSHRDAHDREHLVVRLFGMRLHLKSPLDALPRTTTVQILFDQPTAIYVPNFAFAAPAQAMKTGYPSNRRECHTLRLGACPNAVGAVAHLGPLRTCEAPPPSQEALR